MTATVVAKTDHDKTFQLINTFAQTIRPSANLLAQILNATFCHRDYYPDFTRYCISDFNDGPVCCIEFFAPTQMCKTATPHLKISLQNNHDFQRLEVERWFNQKDYTVAETSKSALTFRTFGCTIQFDFSPYVNMLQSFTIVWH